MATGPLPRTRSWNAQRTADPPAGDQLTLQGAPALDEQGLKKPSAPRRCPPAILSANLAPALPRRNLGARHGLSTRETDGANSRSWYALRPAIMNGGNLRSGDPAGIGQEMWSPLSLYQAICTVMVGGAESLLGTDPDHCCCFSITLHTPVTR